MWPTDFNSGEPRRTKSQLFFVAEMNHFDEVIRKANLLNRFRRLATEMEEAGLDVLKCADRILKTETAYRVTPELRAENDNLLIVGEMKEAEENQCSYCVTDSDLMAGGEV